MGINFLTRSQTKISPTKAVTYTRHFSVDREVKKIKDSGDKITHQGWHNWGIQLHIQNNYNSCKWLCIKPGIQERGTECEERGEWGECYILGNVTKRSGECHQTFQGMSSNIPGNVIKNSGECHQTFRRISPNIPGNVVRHSGECHQTFRGMSSKNPGNVIKHSRECPQTFRGILPIFGVKEDVKHL